MPLRDVELLIQRFLDGELTRADRRELLRLVGSRPDVRQRILDDESMLDAAEGLPRASLPADFVSRTVARLPVQDARSDGPQPRVADWTRRLAMAAAAVVLVAAGFWSGRQSGPGEAGPVADVAGSSDSTVLVRLVLVAPDARSVAVAGDFNGWDPIRAPLERTDNGLWTALVPLTEGRYHYMFFVDGQRWVADPLAAESSLDGFGAENSVIDVEL